MAYVNVKDWSVEQVTEWLKGLDNSISHYTQSFLNNGVNGQQLLNIRLDDLEHLGVKILGHQEIIIESIVQLRNIHYELDKENLQLLALRLSCTANSLNKELQYNDNNTTVVQMQTLSDVHNVIKTIKPIVYWLNRSPFADNVEYTELKKELLMLGLEMATQGNRGKFSEQPNQSIRDNCEKLAKLADKIIQDSFDPIILQPATLDLTTLKKKEQDLGFSVLPSYNLVHQIADIKFGSPAQLSKKIDEGDEIIQINYQTVIGWETKKVLLLMQEPPTEIVLTLKKRPRHTKVYGQIYMKPYRLPSKKKAEKRWYENLPSPQLLQNYVLPQIPKITPIMDNIESDSGSECETPDSPLENSGRMIPFKPRSVLQRRNTITGATPTNKQSSHEIEQYWKLLKNEAKTTHASSYNLPTDKFEEDPMYLRDKSVSCSHGLELGERPTTVIGLTHNRKNSFKTDFPEKIKKNVNFDDTKIIINDISELKVDDRKSISTTSLSSLKDETIDFIDEAEDLQDRSKMTLDVDLIDTNKCVKEIVSCKTKLNKSPLKDTVLEDVHIDNIIKKFEVVDKPKKLSKKVPVVPQKPIVFPRPPKSRGKLDKSHSTPAYDLTSEEDIPKECPLTPMDENPIKLSAIEFPSNVAKENPRQLTHKLSFREVNELPKIPPQDIAKFSHQEKATKPIEVTFPQHDSLKYLQDNKSNNEDESMSFSQISEQDSKISQSTIRYELGIPTIHKVINCNSLALEVRKKSDVPPKPPPRTNIPESYKRKVLPPPEALNPKIAEVTMQLKLNEALEAAASIDFEPSAVSSPITKQPKEDVLKIDTKKSSPTNILGRAISKNKSAKKKNSLLLKRRKVSVSDVTPGEIQGYLYKRLRSKHNQNVHWEKRWFVLNQNCLYGFKSKESLKAECYIYLAGFTVTEATEVKSRPFAFKVYHTGTVFYFSAENHEILLSWTESITSATFNPDVSRSTDQILYSESDNDSDTETPSKSSTLEKPNDGIRKFNSLKKFTSKKRDSSDGITSLDRKWFFNKSSNKKNALPVPTAQFRSYRKVPASTTFGNFTSHIANYGAKSEIHDNISNLSMDSMSQINESYKLHSSNVSLDTEYKCNSSLYYDSFNQCMESNNTPEMVYPKKTHLRTSSDCSEPKKESSCFSKRSSSIKSGTHSFNTPKNSKNHSLPRTPKSAEPNFARHKSNSSKSLSKELSQGMIYCPQTTMNDVQFAQNRTLDGRKFNETPKCLKPAMHYTPLATPLSPEDKRFNTKFELNLDDRAVSNTSKSSKFRQLFMKQDSKKEKRLPKFSKSEDLGISPDSIVASSYLPEVSYSQVQSAPPSADYPGLEYPPVFKAETYSLSNPQSTLFRKQNK